MFTFAHDNGIQQTVSKTACVRMKIFSEFKVKPIKLSLKSLLNVIASLWIFRMSIDESDKKNACLHISYIYFFIFFLIVNCFNKYVVIKECVYWIIRALLTHWVTISFKLTSSLCKMIWRFELNWTYAFAQICRNNTGSYTRFYILDCPSLIHI